jgi:RNA exonuclease 1
LPISMYDSAIVGPELIVVSQYAKIISLDPDLPASTALRQEQDTAGVTNKHSYSQAIHNVLIELRQRPLPESLDSPHVGTIQDSREKVRLDEERRNSAITVDRVAPYVIPLSRLEQWGFITHVPDEPGDTEPEAIGKQETCDRCHDKFTVSDEIDYAGFTRQAGRGECVYHWGKLAPARQEGTKVWLWSCCGESRHSEGCVDGLHVFRDGYPFGHVLQPGEVPEEVLLHRRRAFKTTRQVIEERRAANGEYGDRKRKVEETFDIVALDCEMISECVALFPR